MTGHQLGQIDGVGRCGGEHRYFVADRAATALPAVMHIFIVCTACGDSKDLQFPIGSELAYIGSGSNHVEIQKVS